MRLLLWIIYLSCCGFGIHFDTRPLRTEQAVYQALHLILFELQDISFQFQLQSLESSLKVPGVLLRVLWRSDGDEIVPLRSPWPSVNGLLYLAACIASLAASGHIPTNYHPLSFRVALLARREGEQEVGRGQFALVPVGA